MVDDTPEEDKWLQKELPRPRVCIHEWADMYCQWGLKKSNLDIMLVTFFCKKCLSIRTKELDHSNFASPKEIEDEDDTE